MNKTQIKAEIVADSLSSQGERLTSLLITFPRIILSEMNTHRMLSKNTSSSRAIPFKKMVESVQNDPFIPIAWQKAHSGMQGSEYIKEEWENLCIGQWLTARDCAIKNAEELAGGWKQGDNVSGGVTKQLCNRLLEPFMWTTMLITGSKEGWDNFFELRCPQYEFQGGTLTKQMFKSKKEFIKKASYNENNIPKTDLDWLKLNKGQAEIHIMNLAEKVYDAMNESTPKQLQAGEWHIPFEDRIHKVDTSVFNSPELVNPSFDLIRVKISTAMAARTSYTIVGDEKGIDYEKMFGLHDRLLAQDPPHSSPMEHCARAMSNDEYNSYIKGNIHDFADRTLQKEIKEYTGKTFVIGEATNERLGWCRNFKGFIQYRHIIESEKQ